MNRASARSSTRAAAACACIACALACLTAKAGELCGHGPLRILLTNDDGYQAPGIRALYDALRGAGHDVTLVAPASNMSGASASLTMSELTVSSESDRGRSSGAACWSAQTAPHTPAGSSSSLPEHGHPKLFATFFADDSLFLNGRC